ncbi:MAG TPA: hypothetical protein PK264_00990 [Hyphomicrobiaceae bacterium]|nr:hypothetical protein [Hyphomicrobiaceae bacterium]
MTQSAPKLNYWNATWSLDEKQCPCDIHFLDYLEATGMRGKAIFHMGTGNHHIIGLKTASNGSGNHVLGITASREEYDDYVKLLIANPRLGFTYKAYFGDLYQIDGKLLPELDLVTLFHLGEYRTEANDSYGALTDLEATLVLADRLRAGGEIHFYSGSFAYDKAAAAARELARLRSFEEAEPFKTLRIWRKR